MHLLVFAFFSLAGLAAVLGSPARFNSFKNNAVPPERPKLNDLHRSTFIKPRPRL